VSDIRGIKKRDDIAQILYDSAALDTKSAKQLQLLKSYLPEDSLLFAINAEAVIANGVVEALPMLNAMRIALAADPDEFAWTTRQIALTRDASELAKQLQKLEGKPKKKGR